MDDSFILAIEKIDAASKALKPDDRKSVIGLGAALEAILSDLPEGSACLTDLIPYCLEGLQAVYEGSASDNKRLCESISKSVDTALKYLRGEQEEDWDGLLDEAKDSLLKVFVKNTDDAETLEPDDLAREVTLHDVAAFFVLMDTGDGPDLEKLRRDLSTVRDRQTLSDTAIECISSALENLDVLISRDGSDPAEDLARIGRLIESAIDEIEDVELGYCSEAASTPTALNASVTSADSSVSDSADVVSAAVDAAPELIAEFVTECYEYIEAAESALLVLEGDSEGPDSSPEQALEAINTIFRAFHTIKGTSSFLGLNLISELAHQAESLLSRIRDHEFCFNGACAELAFRSVDTLKELLQTVQDSSGRGAIGKPAGYDDLLLLLANPDDNSAVSDPGIGEKPSAEENDTVEISANGKASEADQAELDTQPSADDAESLSEVVKAVRADRLMSADPSVETIRVRTDRLDRLIDIVGELTIAQSMIAQEVAAVIPYRSELARRVAHMSKMVRELQHYSLSTRMVLLYATFQKLARLARDLAHKSGKRVNFHIEGEDTEIDRNMVNIISDPLMHMVRNAVDHGIEPLQERAKMGKPETGTIRLRAYHSGGNVVVEVRDDGRGLDAEKIVAKAVVNGLIESDKGLTQNQIFNLIFQPGFSTADHLTDISGRGVGLDVVTKGVEALRGRIEVKSSQGRGSIFTVRLPLTLAVTDGTLVRIGDERFIIPTLDILTSFQPSIDELSTVAGRGEFVMHHKELMPVVRLHRLFAIPNACEYPTGGLLVVVAEGDKRFALLVDELLGRQHSVVKSLTGGMERISGISGGVILGDGRVGLILDVRQVIALSKQMHVEQNKEAYLEAA